MSYPHTDVLCIGAGLGASTAATEFGGTFVEAANVTEAIRLRDAKQHRYVLLNADKSTRDELDAKHISYITIAPESTDIAIRAAWTARWLKAGSSAEDIRKRLARWILNSDMCESGIVVFCPVDKWLSQLTAQSRASAADGKDV